MSIIDLAYLQCQGLGGDLKKIQLEIRDAKENQLLKELERCQQHNENSPSYQRRRKWFKIDV